TTKRALFHESNVSERLALTCAQCCKTKSLLHFAARLKEAGTVFAPVRAHCIKGKLSRGAVRGGAIRKTKISRHPAPASPNRSQLSGDANHRCERSTTRECIRGRLGEPRGRRDRRRYR